MAVALPFVNINYQPRVYGLSQRLNIFQTTSQKCSSIGSPPLFRADSQCIVNWDDGPFQFVRNFKLFFSIFVLISRCTYMNQRYRCMPVIDEKAPKLLLSLKPFQEKVKQNLRLYYNLWLFCLCKYTRFRQKKKSRPLFFPL